MRDTNANAPVPVVQEEASGTTLQFVVFALGDEPCAFPMESVREIIRVPRLIPVPLGPPSLLGLVNLRGTVLPVVDLRSLVGLPQQERDDATRILVVDHHGTAAGLLVDRVLRVESVEAGSIEGAQGIEASLPGSTLEGVIHAGDQLVLLLDPVRLLDEHVGADLSAAEGSSALATAAARNATDDPGEDAAATEQVQLVGFDAAGEEYALPIEDVEEIVRVPASIREIPGTPGHVLGLADLRGRALPLVTLRGLFGLPCEELDDAARVLVVRPSRAGRAMPAVGVVVDGVHEVLSVPRTAIEPTPALLASAGDLGEITGICRLDGGERLVALIDAARLLGAGSIRAALASAAEEGDGQMAETTETRDAIGEDDPQFVVFQLADEEYCAPIEQVQEIIRVPERLNEVPGTPDFVEGLINLRGTVLPVIDLRKRFGIAANEDRDRQRILVLDTGASRTGMIVDSVSEVLRLPASRLETAPAAASSAIDAVRQVANLPDQERMLFVLDVARVLDEGERASLEDAMDAIDTAGQDAAATEKEPTHA